MQACFKKTMKIAKSKNFQSAARTIRYDFFVKVAKKTKISTILMAHNLDDFVETAYMLQQRKSKSLFYGIRSRFKYEGVIIDRPLIGFRKNMLEQYCIKHNVPYGIDETNLADCYERNKVRKIISK